MNSVLSRRSGTMVNRKRLRRSLWCCGIYSAVHNARAPVSPVGEVAAWGEDTWPEGEACGRASPAFCSSLFTVFPQVVSEDCLDAQFMGRLNQHT